MPVSSQFPSLDLPEVDIWSFLFERKSKPFPDDKVLYQDAETNRSFTFSQLRSAAIDFGKGLKSVYDWQNGDVLALFTPNSIDTPALTFGALWAGGIVSPANPGYTVAEIAYQLKDCGAKVVATQLASVDTVRKACQQVGLGDESIILLGDGRDPSGRLKHWTSVRNISGTTRFRRAKRDPKKDVAFLVYSSGTTGKPKGVKLSNFNITSNILQIQRGEGGNLSWDGSKTVGDIPLPKKGSGGDKILSCLPFFHIYGLTLMVVQPAYLGLSTVVMARYEIERWCQLVQQHGITYSYIVPPMVLLLSKHPKVPNYDLSSIRMTNSGAAPLTRDLVDAVFKRTGIRVKQGYGLSETSPTAFMQRFEDWYVGVGSVGWMMANMQAKFCVVPGSEGESDGTKELPVGEIGELYVKGPNIFLGYHNKPEATADCLTDDGWYRTGDVGFLDKRGDLYITDRVKELIKYKGFQVPPAELEGYLVDNELVDDVAVLGVESQELGTEVPRAYIVRKGGLKAVQKGDEQKIASWLAAKVANHKKLRGGVRFVETIPKTASGKILRRVLKEEAKKEYKELEDRKLKAKL